LSKINVKKLHRIFKAMRTPLEVDKKSNIIDYNWHVDGILKNSQSYNKESERREEEE